MSPAELLNRNCNLHFMLALFCILYGFHNFANGVSLGFSGMTKYEENSYIVVLDVKSHKNGTRFGKLTVNHEGKQSFTAITVNDWKHPDGRGNDFESVCKVPATDNEFLLAEAGAWKGKFARIFHVRVKGETAEVISVFKEPIFQGTTPEIQGDNYEGMLCFQFHSTNFVMLGERGGSDLYHEGVLRLGKLNLESKTIEWLPPSEFTKRVYPQKAWAEKEGIRSISDLFLDDAGIIWASATEDSGDAGPFNSLVYAVGKLKFKNNKVLVKPVAYQEFPIHGFKVEALASPPAVIKNTKFSIGTEDEDLGGVWRVLSN